MSVIKYEEKKNYMIKPPFNLEKIARAVKCEYLINSTKNKQYIHLKNKVLNYKKKKNELFNNSLYKLRKNRSSPNLEEFDNSNNNILQTFINQTSEIRQEENNVFDLKSYIESRSKQQVKICSFFNINKDPDDSENYHPIKNINEVNEIYNLNLNLNYPKNNNNKFPKTSKLGSILNLFRKYAYNNSNKENNFVNNEKENKSSLFITNNTKIRLKKNYSALNNKIIEKDGNIALDCLRSKAFGNDKLSKALLDKNMNFPTIELFKQDPLYQRIHKINYLLPKILKNNTNSIY